MAGQSRALLRPGGGACRRSSREIGVVFVQRTQLWRDRAEALMSGVDTQALTCVLWSAMGEADLLFKALADSGRRELLDRLHAHDGQTLSELCQHLEMTRQGVAQHLAVLEAANLVAVHWRGREKLHFLNPVPLQEIYERWIRKFEEPRIEALSELKRPLEEGDEPHQPRRRPSRAQPIEASSST
jgi:DNA-binding transcriptional ArsR family regulator